MLKRSRLKRNRSDAENGGHAQIKKPCVEFTFKGGDGFEQQQMTKSGDNGQLVFVNEPSNALLDTINSPGQNHAESIVRLDELNLLKLNECKSKLENTESIVESASNNSSANEETLIIRSSSSSHFSSTKITNISQDSVLDCKVFDIHNSEKKSIEDCSKNKSFSGTFKFDSLDEQISTYTPNSCSDLKISVENNGTDKIIFSSQCFNLNICTDELVNTEVEDDPEKRCPICRQELLCYDAQKKQEHLNECLNKEEMMEKQRKSESEWIQQEKKKVLPCPICGKSLLTYNGRVSHLKKCQSEYSIAPRSLMQLVFKQEEERDAHLEEEAARKFSLRGKLMTALDTMSLTTRFKRSPAAKKKKFRLEEPTTKFDEDTQLAIALSTSMEVEPEEARCPNPTTIEQTGLMTNNAIHSTTAASKRGRNALTVIRNVEKNCKQTKKKSAKNNSAKMGNQYPLLVIDPLDGKMLIEEKFTKTMKESNNLTFYNKMTHARTFRPSCLLGKYESKRSLWEMNSFVEFKSKFYKATLSMYLVPELFEIKRNGSKEVVSLVQKDKMSIVPVPVPNSQSPVFTQTAYLLCGLANKYVTVEDENDKLDDETQSSQLDSNFLVSSTGIDELKRDNKSGGSLSECYLSMVNNPMLSDLKLLLEDGKEFYAHKFVIAARCPRLFEIIADKQEQKFHAFNYNVVFYFFQFLYANVVLFDCSTASDVLILAEKFEVVKLEDICKSMLDGSASAKLMNINLFQHKTSNVCTEQKKPSSSVTECNDADSINCEEKVEWSDDSDDELEEVYEYMQTQKMTKLKDVKPLEHVSDRDDVDDDVFSGFNESEISLETYITDTSSAVLSNGLMVAGKSETDDEIMFCDEVDSIPEELEIEDNLSVSKSSKNFEQELIPDMKNEITNHFRNTKCTSPKYTESNLHNNDCYDYAYCDDGSMVENVDKNLESNEVVEADENLEATKEKYKMSSSYRSCSPDLFSSSCFDSFSCDGSVLKHQSQCFTDDNQFGVSAQNSSRDRDDNNSIIINDDKKEFSVENPSNYKRNSMSETLRDDKSNIFIPLNTDKEKHLLTSEKLSFQTSEVDVNKKSPVNNIYKQMDNFNMCKDVEDVELVTKSTEDDLPLREFENVPDDVWQDFHESFNCSTAFHLNVSLSQPILQQTPKCGKTRRLSLTPSTTPVKLNKIPEESFSPPTDVSHMETPLSSTRRHSLVTETPVSVKMFRSKSATPMLKYDAMATPVLKQYCQGFGVRALSKNKMIKVLKNIYYGTHPGAQATPVPVGKKQRKSNKKNSMNKLNQNENKKESPDQLNENENHKSCLKVSKFIQNSNLDLPQGLFSNAVEKKRTFTFKNRVPVRHVTSLAADLLSLPTNPLKANIPTQNLFMSSQKSVQQNSAEMNVDDNDYDNDDDDDNGDDDSWTRHFKDYLGRGNDNDDNDDDDDEGLNNDVEMMSSQKSKKKVEKLSEEEKKEKLFDFFHNDKKKFLQILHYEPFELHELVNDLKLKNLKISKQFLIEFMDEKNILFTTRAANATSNRNGPQTKKLPLKAISEMI